MSNNSFGNSPFGANPFGHIDWSRIVLWEELPSEMKESDAQAGYPYREFVYSFCPGFDWLRSNIDRFKYLDDPNKIRLNLLSYLASNFGIDLDEEQPESYQRMRVQIAGRWNIIKGTILSYIVLCKIYGFECDVIPLWWNGVDYIEDGPTVYNVNSPCTYEDVGGERIFVINPEHYPISPGTIRIEFENTVTGINFSLTDNGEGDFNDVRVVSSYIDYGWGYIKIRLDDVIYDFVESDYGSVVGGCPDLPYMRCKTHRIRLRITPGDIAFHDELTITEAFKRLYEKIGALTGSGVVPIHVEIEQLLYSAAGYLSIGHRYDIIPADVEAADTGLVWSVP